MVNRYVVYSSEKEDGQWEFQVETDRLETAIDFAEFYRIKYPDRYYQVRGVSYNRSSFKEGNILSEWDPVPDGMFDNEISDFVMFLRGGRE